VRGKGWHGTGGETNGAGVDSYRFLRPGREWWTAAVAGEASSAVVDREGNCATVARIYPRVWDYYASCSCYSGNFPTTALTASCHSTEPPVFQVFENTPRGLGFGFWRPSSGRYTHNSGLQTGASSLSALPCVTTRR
jgi:hypothetical protein